MSIYKVVTRWVDIHTTTPNAKHLNRTCRCNVFFEGHKIYSYGSHFELARALKDKDGKTTLFLLNGDTVSVSTGRHQSEIRSAVQRSGVPHVIIPFSALEAAGVDKDSVQLHEELPQRVETINHTAYAQPEGSVWVDEPVYQYVNLSPAELEALVDIRHAKAVQSWEDQKRRHAERPTLWQKPRDEPPARGKVEDLESWDRQRYTLTHHNRVLRTSKRTYAPGITVTQLDDGRTAYTWESRRHWLGESLITATSVTSKVTICRSCKGTGLHPDAPPRPERPEWNSEQTPDERSAAWKGYHDAAELWDETWAWRGAKRCPKCEGHAQKRRTIRRKSKYLSGFDRNESRPSYFFCELPRTDATTVEAAYEALKPDTVKLAEQMGRKVERQGDIFAVPLPATNRRSLRKLGATFTKRGTLLGTNHEATETAVLPDGTTFVRGCLYHAPELRRPDHARTKLADGWSVVVKNTVPLTA